MQNKWIRCKKTQHNLSCKILISECIYFETMLTITLNENLYAILPIMVWCWVNHKVLRAWHYIALCDFLSNFRAYMLIISFTSGSVYSICEYSLGGYSILDIFEMSKMRYLKVKCVEKRKRIHLFLHNCRCKYEKNKSVYVGT